MFTALDPLRLLGIVTIVREYGDAWDRTDVYSAFAIKLAKEKNWKVRGVEMQDEYTINESAPSKGYNV